MLARSPVTRLSIATTWCPSAIRRSTMWLPMKPAPPVIRILIVLSSYSSVFESGGFHRLWVKHVTPVNQHFRVHHLADFVQVQIAELFPFGDDYDGVAILSEFNGAGRVLDLQVRILPGASFVGNRVVGLYARTHFQQFACDFQRRSIANVVGFGFEGQPQQTN